MRTRILATWAIGILGILLGRPVCAATAVVLYEPQRPAIAFGANDLVEALRQKRIVVETADPGALTTKKAALHVVITTTDARVGVEQRPNGFPHAVLRSVVGRIVSQPVPAGLLAGIGITAGENMGDLDNAGKERWLWDTYGTQGIGYPDAPSARSSPAIRQVRERIERSVSLTLQFSSKEESVHSRTPISLTFSVRLPSVTATGRWRERGRIVSGEGLDPIPRGQARAAGVRKDKTV